MRNVFRIIKKYSNSQSQWLKQVRAKFNLVRKQERIADWRRYVQSNKFRSYANASIMKRVFHELIFNKSLAQERELIARRFHIDQMAKLAVRRIRNYIIRNNNLGILLSKFLKLKSFRLKTNGYLALKNYLKHIRHL